MGTQKTKVVLFFIADVMPAPFCFAYDITENGYNQFNVNKNNSKNKKMKEILIEIISSYGTWQIDNDNRNGTWIDEEDIENIAEAIVAMLDSNKPKT